MTDYLKQTYMKRLISILSLAFVFTLFSCEPLAYQKDDSGVTVKI